MLKMRKIQIKTANTVQETFDRFLPVKKAARLIDKTIDLDSSFRHTFARKYLLDCGGNAFTLGKLLGDSAPDITKHY